MNFDNLDLYRIESPRFNVYTGSLIIKKGTIYHKTIDKDKTYEKKVKFSQKINLALLLEKRKEELVLIPDLEEVELSNFPIEFKDEKLVYWNKENTEVPLEYLNRLYTLFNKDQEELISVDDLVKRIEEHIDEVNEELRQEYQSYVDNIKPSLQLIDEWIISYFEGYDYGSPGYGYYHHPEIYRNIIDKVYQVLENELGLTRYNTYGDSTLFDMKIADAYFYIKCDEMQHSPSMRFINHFTSEFQKHYDSLLIPSSGPAKDMYSEIVSNLHYSLYRYFNDGDIAEDILHERNCLVMINIIEYLDDLDTKRCLIFNYYYEKAMNLVHSSYMTGKSLPDSLDEFIEKTEVKEHCRKWPEELEKAILDKTILTSEKDYYDYYDFNFNWRECEFLILDAVDILLAMYIIGKEYPKLFDGLRVYDLRKRYWKS